jgi:hypothetical protein
VMATVMMHGSPMSIYSGMGMRLLPSGTL